MRTIFHAKHFHVSVRIRVQPRYGNIYGHVMNKDTQWRVWKIILAKSSMILYCVLFVRFQRFQALFVSWAMNETHFEKHSVTYHLATIAILTLLNNSKSLFIYIYMIKWRALIIFIWFVKFTMVHLISGEKKKKKRNIHYYFEWDNIERLLGKWHYNSKIIILKDLE